MPAIGWATSLPPTPHRACPRFPLHCSIAAAGSLSSALMQGAGRALNHYKHAIFLHTSVNRRLLVQYGIRAILQVIEHDLKEVQQ
jgi:hypothetical protein